MKKIISILLLAVLLLSLLSGCHGSKDLASFEVPEEFDTSRNYEITFWAKNDTNATQVATRPSPTSRRCTPTSP